MCIRDRWSTWSLIKYAITNIVAFSAAPMQLVTAAGVIVLILSVVMGIQTVSYTHLDLYKRQRQEMP